ncbi:MAG: hypothetical protein Ct9H300mP28_11540 [Pseudomonadota bacterium]|nr:MAG: hypothetical protein Ct9H300mP28_11540 [Pseudomonadota bacterium]
MTILKKIENFHDEMTIWRRGIHQHPELAFEETVLRVLLRKIERIWFRDTSGTGKTGVVGTIRNGEGPSIGLRADLDALPLEEKNTFEHASVNPGKKHACGQTDIPQCFLEQLNIWQQAKISGDVHFIFHQPKKAAVAVILWLRKVCLKNFLLIQFWNA